MKRVRAKNENESNEPNAVAQSTVDDGGPCVRHKILNIEKIIPTKRQFREAKVRNLPSGMCLCVNVLV